MPEVKVIAPWRDPEFNQLIKGRQDAIEYAEKHGIPVKATSKQPWSSDENLLHISYEAGMLEDPAARPRDDMFEWTVDPKNAPDEAEEITVSYEKGIPTAVNGEKLSPGKMLEKLNDIGSKHGVGRVDLVESRYVGMKSRGVYETPGGTILETGHRDLETLSTDREVIYLKDSLMPRWAKNVYNGYWYTHEMDALDAMLQESERFVTGDVTMELYKGNINVIGRTSPESLYDDQIASMDDDQGAFNQADSTGFIRILSLPLRVQASRRPRDL
jgi:argininosuccinate synthase